MPYNTDENHAQIKQYFLDCYWSVFDAAAVGGGFTDLVVGGYHQQLGRNITTLVEVKTESGKLNGFQRDFFETWRGSVHIARTMADVLTICGLERRPAAGPFARLADEIEKRFCCCHKAYTGRGLVDPHCQAHDIAEFLRLENN